MNTPPNGVLYDPEHRDFYRASDMSSMGKEFRREWIELAHLFPQITNAEDAA